jgi:hypothetical protein
MEEAVLVLGLVTAWASELVWVSDSARVWELASEPAMGLALTAKATVPQERNRTQRKDYMRSTRRRYIA